MKKIAVLILVLASHIALSGCIRYSSSTYIDKQIIDKFGTYQYERKKLEGNTNYIRWPINKEYLHEELWSIAQFRSHEICKTDRIFYDYGEISQQQSQFKSIVNAGPISINTSHLGIEVRFYCDLDDNELAKRYKEAAWWEEYYKEHPEKAPVDRLKIVNTLQSKTSNTSNTSG